MGDRRKASLRWWPPAIILTSKGLGSAVWFGYKQSWAGESSNKYGVIFQHEAGVFAPIVKPLYAALWLESRPRSLEVVLGVRLPLFGLNKRKKIIRFMAGLPNLDYDRFYRLWFCIAPWAEPRFAWDFNPLIPAEDPDLFWWETDHAV